MKPTIDFMRELYTGTTGHIEIAFIAPAGLDLQPSIMWRHYQIGGVRRVDWTDVQALNTRGYGVYYGATTKHRIPTKRACEADTAMLSALWVEIDLKDGDYPDRAAAVRAVNDLLHMPTTIIDSGGGIHALWRIAPVEVTRNNRDAIKRILRGMAIKVKGDTSVAELARVLRLPGTVNTKPARKGAACAVLDTLPGGEYRLRQFDQYAVKPPVRQRVSVTLPPGAQTSLPRWVQTYLETGASDGERNRRLFAATIEYRANGYTLADAERDLGARARADGLSERETARTIESGWKSPHGGTPNVTRHVRERLRAMN